LKGDLLLGEIKQFSTLIETPGHSIGEQLPYFLLGRDELCISFK
jgi:hypothetical protein